MNIEIKDFENDSYKREKESRKIKFKQSSFSVIYNTFKDFIKRKLVNLVDKKIEKATDYFEDYDYILGDFSYDKVRLKGYYDSTNKKANKINDYKDIDNYIENYCSFGARVFVLKKIK